MSTKKTFIALVALAVAAAFSPISDLQAATFNPGSQPTSGKLVQSIKMKKKGYKKTGKRRMAQRKRSRRGAGQGKSCGTFMYRKGGKCMDARNKS